MKSILDIAGYIANKYDAKLQPEELQRFASIMDVRELKKGEMFLNQGQIAKDILYVRSGTRRDFIRTAIPSAIIGR
jgi:CRP-like cAMP-binding protein